MRLALTGRHVEIPLPLRRLVDVKLAKLDRLLNDNALSAQAVLARQKHQCRVEITLHARGEHVLHAVASSTSWDLAFRRAVTKISQQASTVKGKWQGRKRPGRGGARTAPRSRGRSAR